MPPANTSMSKSRKSPVSSSRQDQVLEGLLPEPLRLALDLFVAVFFVGSFAATIVIFLSVVPTTFFLAEFARFVVGFPAAILRSSGIRRAAVSALALSSYVKSVVGLSSLFTVFSFSKCFA